MAFSAEKLSVSPTSVFVAHELAVRRRSLTAILTKEAAAICCKLSGPRLTCCNEWIGLRMNIIKLTCCNIRMGLNDCKDKISQI
jgi:hypothetical protein